MKTEECSAIISLIKSAVDKGKCPKKCYVMFCQQVEGPAVASQAADMPHSDWGGGEGWRVRCPDRSLLLHKELS